MSEHRNIVSSAIPFASVEDMLRRYDRRIIARLVSDTGSPVDENSLGDNAVLLSLLKEASAIVESYAYKGMRYTRDDLVAIYQSNTVSRELLVGLVCALTMHLLWRRRGDPAVNTTSDWEIVNGMLRQLERGDNVFAFEGIMHSGIALELATESEIMHSSPRMIALRRIFGNVLNE